jgi:hypothetical protein
VGISISHFVPQETLFRLQFSHFFALRGTLLLVVLSREQGSLPWQT